MSTATGLPERFLDQANVPRNTEHNGKTRMLTLSERVSWLIRDRDEARKLAADMAKEQAEARGRNMMAQRYVDELAHDIAVVTQHRKAQSSGGQHVGTGGRLGNTPPSTLAYLERLVNDLRAVLDGGKP